MLTRVAGNSGQRGAAFARPVPVPEMEGTWLNDPMKSKERVTHRGEQFLCLGDGTLKQDQAADTAPGLLRSCHLSSVLPSSPTPRAPLEIKFSDWGVCPSFAGSYSVCASGGSFM